MDYSLKEVAGRIKDLREAKGYTKEQLAKLTGVSFEDYNRLENGETDFSFTFNKYIDRNKFNIQDAGTQFSNHLKKLTQKLTHTETPKANNINGLKIVNEDNN